MDGFGLEEFPNLPTPPQLDLEPSGTCVPLDQPLVDLLQACFKAAALNKVREDIAEVLKTFGFYDVESCAGVGKVIANASPGTEAERSLLGAVVERICGSTGSKNKNCQKILDFFKAAAESGSEAERAARAREKTKESAVALHQRLSTLYNCNHKDFASKVLELFFGTEAQKDRYLDGVKVDEEGRPRCPWPGCMTATHYTWKFPGSSAKTHHRLIEHIAKEHFGDSALAHSGHGAGAKRPGELALGQQTLSFNKAPRSEGTAAASAPSSTSSSAPPPSCL